MKTTLLALICLLAMPAYANESPEALQDAFTTALQNNDSAGLAACYAEDAVNFPVDEMVGIGPDSVKESWDHFFTAYKVLGLDLSDGHMVTHGDFAAAWGLWTMMVEPVEGGEAFQMAGRYMDVARNFDGKWLYVADHASVPTPAEEEAEE